MSVQLRYLDTTILAVDAALTAANEVEYLTAFTSMQEEPAPTILNVVELAIVRISLALGVWLIIAVVDAKAFATG